MHHTPCTHDSLGFFTVIQLRRHTQLCVKIQLQKRVKLKALETKKMGKKEKAIQAGRTVMIRRDAGAGLNILGMNRRKNNVEIMT